MTAEHRPVPAKLLVRAGPRGRHWRITQRGSRGSVVRLRHRRCRLGRLHSRQPAQRGRQVHRVPAGSRAAGLEPLHPHPGGVHQDPDQPQRQLALPVRAQPLDRRAGDWRTPRQDPGWFQLHQRAYLQSRPANGLRRLGSERKPRVGLRRRPALFSPLRAPGRRRRRHVPGPGREPGGNRPQLPPPAVRSLHGWRRGDRDSPQPGLQRRAARRDLLRAAHHLPAPPHEYRQGVPETSPVALQPDGAYPRPRHPHFARR